MWVQTNITQNLPYQNYGFLQTWAAYPSTFLQRLDYITGACCTRTYYSNGTTTQWYDWRWIVAPGATDVEYLLAQRYRGLNLYQRTVSCGLWNPGKYVQIELGQGVTVVDCSAHLDGFVMPFIYGNDLTNSNTSYIAVQTNGDAGFAVWMRGGSVMDTPGTSTGEGHTLYVTVKYYK